MSKLQETLVAFVNDIKGDGGQTTWEGLTAHERSVITSYENELRKLDLDPREEELYRIHREFDKYGTKTNIPTKLLNRYISNRMRDIAS